MQSPEHRGISMPEGQHDLFTTELAKKLEQLRDGTPRSDRSGDERESQQLSEAIRAELIQMGVPPCYPESMKVPLDPPDQYKAIVHYFQHAMGAFEDVLYAQRARIYQHMSRQRRARRNGKFARYLDENLKRRRRHGYKSNVLIAEDYEHHSKLQNWVEYEDYELRELEKLQDEKLKIESRDKSSWVDHPEGFQLDPEIGDYRQHSLLASEKAIEEHWDLLNWIRREGEKMAAETDSEPRRLRRRPHAAEVMVENPSDIGNPNTAPSRQPRPAKQPKKTKRVVQSATAPRKKARPSLSSVSDPGSVISKKSPIKRPRKATKPTKTRARPKKARGTNLAEPVSATKRPHSRGRSMKLHTPVKATGSNSTPNKSVASAKRKAGRDAISAASKRLRSAK